MTAIGMSALFLDIGNVLLTNGWDRLARKRAAEHFGLDLHEMDERHHLTFDTYEEGKLSLREYLDRVVFFEQRPFSMEDFKAFMFAQSQPYPEMIGYIRDLKAHYGLRVVAVSNEGRELTEYRIRAFNLDSFIDFFICSCFIHMRKPDADMYRLELDCAQVPPDRAVYVDDREMFVAVAGNLGLRAVHHLGYESTRAQLEAMGLSLSH
jgi:putative hydrolase of the HAD superfamily